MRKMSPLSIRCLIHGAELPQQVLAADKLITVQMNTYFVGNSKCQASIQRALHGRVQGKRVSEGFSVRLMAGKRGRDKFLSI